MQAMINAEEQGGVLSEEELLGTVCSCCPQDMHNHAPDRNGTLALLQHPDQLQQLRDDPALISPAGRRIIAL